MEYVELVPEPKLRPFLSCFWSLQANAEGQAQDVERILPDGCPEIIVNRADPFRRLQADGSSREQEDVLLVGPFKRAVTILPTGEVDLIGIRFEPGGLHALLGLPMHELEGIDTCLSQADSRLRAELLNACRPGPLQLRLPELERLFKTWLERTRSASLTNAGLVGAAVRFVETRLYNADGIAAALGIHRRALERIFRTEVGLSPKVYARIHRLQTVLQQLDDPRAVHDWATLAQANGFSDQSHLIREFRLLAGTTPKRYLDERTALASCFEAGELSHSSNP